MHHDIDLILNDRESGSVALLNRLITALEAALRGTGLKEEAFLDELIVIRLKLKHFAAIENFLASFISSARHQGSFPGAALQFIRDYRLYWDDSSGKIAKNFLKECNPEGKTILTHSHSQTVISLLEQLHAEQIPFRVIQTLSSPGEEGKKSHERMCELNIQADLIDDKNIKEALVHTDLILTGCDALLEQKFLNKIGTRTILKEGRHLNKPTFLVTESRKEVTNSDWERELNPLTLFEWVPLSIIDRIVTEKQN